MHMDPRTVLTNSFRFYKVTQINFVFAIIHMLSSNLLQAKEKLHIS